MVSAEIQSKSNVWLRALVDGEVALPSDTLFEWADTGTWDGVRSFRFVKSKLKAGPHIVEIRGWATPRAPDPRTGPYP